MPLFPSQFTRIKVFLFLVNTLFNKSCDTDLPQCFAVPLLPVVYLIFQSHTYITFQKCFFGLSLPSLYLSTCCCFTSTSTSTATATPTSTTTTTTTTATATPTTTTTTTTKIRTRKFAAAEGSSSRRQTLIIYNGKG